jgi:hypothetical protein
MPLLDLHKLTTGLSRTWAGYLRDWDRSLRAGNYPETTRYNYLLAAAQLGRYLAEHSPDPDAPGAAADPAAVTRAHVEAFQAWMIATRSAATALNKHKAVQQFFSWLVDEDEGLVRSPMVRVRQPKTPRKLIPVMRDDDTRKLLDACKGRSFVNLRDEALTPMRPTTQRHLTDHQPMTPSHPVRRFWCTGPSVRARARAKRRSHAPSAAQPDVTRRRTRLDQQQRRIDRLDLGGGRHAVAHDGIALRCATGAADRDRAPTGFWRMPWWMPTTRSTRASPTPPGSTITGWAARTTSPPTARPPKR